MVDPDPDATQPTLAGGRWRLVELDGEAVLDDVHTPYLDLEAGRSTLSGSAGCNRLAGSYESGGAGFRLGRVATTLRACDEEIMRREASFLAALEAADDLAVDAVRLSLLADGRIVARFVRAPWTGPSHAADPVRLVR